jgi:hypothetical protein
MHTIGAVLRIRLGDRQISDQVCRAHTLTMSGGIEGGWAIAKLVGITESEQSLIA